MKNMAEKIKALRTKLGWKQAKLAEEIGVNQTTVSKYESGEQEPKSMANQKLAELAGVSLGEWLGVEPVSTGDVRTRMVPVVGELCAGEWREAIEWAHDDRYEVPALLDPDLPGYPLQGYIVRGTSMNRYYPDGTIVFAAATIANGLRPMNGDHVIVTRHDANGMVEASLKEYVMNDDGSRWLWPRSNDPQHQAPLQYGGAEEVVITGIVQASFITRPRRAEQQKDLGAVDFEDRHRDILARFDRGDTLAAIAESHGITRERVRQIAKEAGRTSRRGQ